jgi:probable rRNA maturation factor
MPVIIAPPLAAPAIELDVQRPCTDPPAPDDATLRAWVAAALADTTAPVALTVRIVDAAESRELNRSYRGKDRPTNVLSFPFEAPPGVPAEQTGGLLGDLVICAPVVAAEADAQHKSRAAHWAHMVIHGLLHLLGYDHENEQQAQVMEARECQLLAGLGFPDPYATDPER